MNASTPNTRARLDTGKNRKLMVLSLALAATGIGLVALGMQRDWGFVGLFWSGVLGLLGVGWVIGLLEGGGVAIADCPHCGARMEFMNIESARTEQCERCGQWSAGVEHMRPLAPDHLAQLPVFPTPLPTGELRWPTDAGGMQRCPVCAEVSTRAIEVQATSVLSDAFAALSPISVQRVHSLRVPACAQHDDGIWLDLDEDQENLILLFRSFAYFRDFEALNARAPTPPTAADAASAADQPETLAAFLTHSPRPAELGAPVTCPKHDIPVLTVMGWVSTMDSLPSHDWLDAAAEHPVCLAIGHHRERPEYGNYTHERIAWCPACEAGMTTR